MPTCDARKRYPTSSNIATHLRHLVYPNTDGCRWTWAASTVVGNGAGCVTLAAADDDDPTGSLQAFRRTSDRFQLLYVVYVWRWKENPPVLVASPVGESTVCIMPSSSPKSILGGAAVVASRRQQE